MDGRDGPVDGGSGEARGYALPYHTRLSGDTEYLISNPGPVMVTGSLTVYGPECRPVGEPVGVRVGPNCTQSVRLRPIVPNHAGHTLLDVDHAVIVGINYLRKDDVLAGSALAGRTAVLAATRAPTTRGFTYRTMPFGPDPLDATLYVSNPNTVVLTGELTVYGERCDQVERRRIRIAPGCTREFPMPAGHFGFGRVRVSGPAVLNLLHFSPAVGGLAAAELLDSGADIDEPPPPGAGILIDDTHGCRGAASGDLTTWEAGIVAAGIPVGHLTGPITLAALQPFRAFAVVMPRVAYSAAEVQAISDYVTAGGGLLVVQDYGVDPSIATMPWSWPTRSVMGAFGLVDENNLAADSLHNEAGGVFRIRFEAATCFAPHPVTTGLAAISVDATCTLVTGGAWTDVVVTDGDATPAGRPVVVERAVGAGRVLALGDSNILCDNTIGENDNLRFAIRCVERVTFRI